MFALCLRLIPLAKAPAHAQRLDLAGAITVTASLMLAVYAIVNGNEAGWRSMQTLGLLGAAVVLMGAFLAIEWRVHSPLMALAMLRLRNVATSNVIGVLWAAAMFAWFFISALYMQLVLGYDPMQVGLAFLPANLIMAAFSLGLSAKLVMRFGIRAPIGAGLLLAAAGLALFVMAPVDGRFGVHVLPGIVLLGFGAGMALNPVLLAAMSDVEPSEVGLASGLAQYRLHDGWGLGAGGPREHRGGAHAGVDPSGCADCRSAQRGLSRGVPVRRDLRGGCGVAGVVRAASRPAAGARGRSGRRPCRARMRHAGFPHGFTTGPLSCAAWT